jgi:bifunctional DNA-binding transcriptional regulator/antitoxin component of YhaV-PrlF toxin-antitoxin module
MAIIKFVRKLQRVSSDSYTLNIPKEIVDKFGWREKQRLEISLTGRAKHIVVKDYKK